MAQPSFYPEGVTALLSDTRLRIWKKILGYYQNQAGALAANNPTINDTLRITKQKVLCAKKGVAFTG